MSWQYGIVHKKLSNNESWYYVAEIHDGKCHSDTDYLTGLGGESINEVIDNVNKLYDDLMLSKTLVIEDVDND
jgi:hypothetical protein